MWNPAQQPECRFLGLKLIEDALHVGTCVERPAEGNIVVMRSVRLGNLVCCGQRNGVPIGTVVELENLPGDFDFRAQARDTIELLTSHDSSHACPPGVCRS